MTLSRPKRTLCSSTVLPQDEFRRWFLAKVRVILAPGRSPFHILDTQTTSPSSIPSPDTPTPATGKGPRHQTSQADPNQELIHRYGEYQPTQVSCTHALARTLPCPTRTHMAMALFSYEISHF